MAPGEPILDEGEEEQNIGSREIQERLAEKEEAIIIILNMMTTMMK